MSSPAYSAPDLVVDSVRPSASAVSWGAIFAGAAAAAALSLILLLLGVGLGLSSVSPWAYDGVSATTFGVSSILWVTFMSLAASAVGGYLAGRLRTKWVSVNTDEVYFRDTAHGFLAWAAATLLTAALLTSAIGSMIGAGAKATAAVAGGVATTAAAGAAGAATGATQATDAKPSLDPSAYFVDSLFRRDGAAAPTTTTSPQENAASASETTRIFANAIRTGSLPQDDQRYLGQLVAQRTGLAPADAEKRVADTFARLQTKLREAEATAKEAADKARKASAYTALWLFISLLAGAFVASLSATFGGRRRDD
ncbi:hypothetical protein DSM104443_00900 [Usitatibacter rugosus]|uniref:Transmembrane protein n=1 Tax=Usitatibacter rugosus TaxID=2732067 RepID=A0A6M4GR80_9PROT|nr:hypothetical protein [Usitatibacter rugosus]QJR09850.1 hypothetical protein DSM104443_00900 [Usitatibacter rugosus]